MSTTGVPTAPSIPFPETQERRAAISREITAATGLDDVALERLVRAFYAAAREDPMLGPLFERVHDWDSHIAGITTFWSSVALMTGRYHGQPMAAHIPLELQPGHFVRWLALFEETAFGICTPAAVAHLMEKARRIAQSLEFGAAAHRGEMPSRDRSTGRP
jgi:hemoglobin